MVALACWLDKSRIPSLRSCSYHCFGVPAAQARNPPSNSVSPDRSLGLQGSNLGTTLVCPFSVRAMSICGCFSPNPRLGKNNSFQDDAEPPELAFTDKQNRFSQDVLTGLRGLSAPTTAVSLQAVVTVWLWFYLVLRACATLVTANATQQRAPDSVR